MLRLKFNFIKHINISSASINTPLTNNILFKDNKFRFNQQEKNPTNWLKQSRTFATNNDINNKIEKNKEITNVANLNEYNKPQWERNDKYRIFYGWNFKDEAEDKMQANFHAFIIFFFFIYLPIFCLYYYPDWRQNEWCYREAHLQIARREKAGEPYVNPDLIPASQIKIPSDQEIGDMEIII